VTVLPPAKARVKRGTAQQHLLESAAQLFAERGYRGTTTKDIAQNAGVSENLIFRYFKSKAELLDAAVINPLFAILQHFIDDSERDAFKTLPTQRVIHGFVGEVVDLIDNHRGLARAMLNVIVERPPDFEIAAIGARFIDILKVMGPEMAEFLSGHELTSTNPALVLRMGLISAITNVVLLPESYGKDEPVPTKAEIVDELTNFVVYGLQPVPPANPYVGDS
jgi:AcrR family transcriptional regulator